jgi:cysteine-rich repeat protein
LLGALVMALLGAILGVALAATSTNVLYGCYEKRGGDLRIRKAGASCRAGEVAVAWNKVGRRGPRGLQGIQGEPGTPGLLASFDQVDGLACTRAGYDGEIDVAYASDGTASLKCVIPEVCGNNVVDSELGEECDDGNQVDGDSCSSTCQTPAVCGDGVVEGGEECDGTPGCTASCTLEPAACGNGAVEAGEQCDDGNSIDDDSCSNACTTNPDAVCGDGIIQSAEQCDDGDVVGGNGCSSDCSVESGWQCAGQPSVCTQP